jgi:hypothetical protein
VEEKVMLDLTVALETEVELALQQNLDLEEDGKYINIEVVENTM